jgi:hypothetical protein
MNRLNFWDAAMRQSDGETGSEPATDPSPEPEAPVADAEVGGEAPPPEPADTSAQPPKGLLDRIGQLTRQKRELEERLAQVEQYRQAPQQGEVDPRDINLEIQYQAQQLAKQQAWKDTTDRVWNEGLQKYGDWAAQLNMMSQILGGIPTTLTEAAIETGMPHEVLYHLAKNPDEAARIAMLSPTKQAVAVAKVAGSLNSPKRVSSAPAPISPKVSGNGSAPASLDDPNLSMDEWARLRNEQERARRKGR